MSLPAAILGQPSASSSRNSTMLLSGPQRLDQRLPRGTGRGARISCIASRTSRSDARGHVGNLSL